MSTDASEQKSQAFRFHVMRYEHRHAWRAQARSGAEIAKLSLSAAEEWMTDLATDHVGCPCCNMMFSRGDIPRAFIVLIPTEPDPKGIKALAAGVCADCCRHDDLWLIEHGVAGTEPAPTTVRPGDRIH
jgi:hypothetical protein